MLQKRGQITIFMILGLVLLFSTLFILFLVSEVKKTNLQDEAEDILTQALKKESLRLYVSDCLEDGFEEGLRLISKQGGRLWADQVGGIQSFTQGVDVDVNEGGRVFYALALQNYDQPQAYPCEIEGTSPVFCSYPQGNAKFGKTQLRLSSIERDLERYLKQKVRECVVEYTHTTISSEATLIDTDILLNVNFFNDGAAILVTYPLKLQSQGQELFHLTTFDFFYQTQFKKVLDAAILFPLEKEVNNINYQYIDDTLKLSQNSFSPTNYADLSLRLDRTIHGATKDTIYTFTPPQGLVMSGDYQLRIARQNRPPALEYVQRLACLQGPSEKQYDYLVVKGSNELVGTTSPTKLGEVSIDLHSQDPDIELRDDGIITSGFENIPSGFVSTSNRPYQFQMAALAVQALTPAIYTLRGYASDGILKDFQDIRVAVEDPIAPTLVSLPLYSDVSLDDGTTLYVSSEDPTLLKINIPSSSDARVVGPVKLTLPDSSVETLAASKCFRFSDGKESVECSNTFDTSSIEIQNVHNPLAQPGAAKLDFTASYCANVPQQSSVSRRIEPVKCIPHINLERPYPYPYHVYQANIKTTNGKQETDFSTLLLKPGIFDPFQATHACCEFNLANPQDKNEWKIKDATATCFSRLGCFGETSYARNKPGWIREEEFVACDGRRGNTCEGPLSYRLPTNELLCGSLNQEGCINSLQNNEQNKIAKECAGKAPWSLVTSSDGSPGFCHGQMGCEIFTSQTNRFLISKKESGVSHEQIALKIKEQVEKGALTPTQIMDNLPTSVSNEIGIKFGACQSGWRCDTDLDLDFSGICEGSTTCNGEPQ